LVALNRKLEPPLNSEKRASAASASKMTMRRTSRRAQPATVASLTLSGENGGKVPADLLD